MDLFLNVNDGFFLNVEVIVGFFLNVEMKFDDFSSVVEIAVN